MGGPVSPDWPVAKGPVPHGLDTISGMPDARARLERLKNAMLGISGNRYRGLETVFEEHVLRPIFNDPKDAAKVAEHLKKHWFDDTSPEAFFPGIQVAEIYADGVLSTIALSLKGGNSPVPIDAWWVVDQHDVKLLPLARVDNNVTKGPSVVLLILTPRPHPALQTGPMMILNKEAVVWISEQQTTRGAITRRKIP